MPKPEEYFKDIPENIRSEIQAINEPNGLDEYELKLFEKTDIYNRHAQMLKSAEKYGMQGNNNVIEKNNEFEQKGITEADVVYATKVQEYIDNQREIKGFADSRFENKNGYMRTLEQQSDKLSDSLMKNNIFSDEYEKLFILMEQNKRLRGKLNVTDTGGDGENEPMQEAYERYKAKFEENRRKLRDQIKLCKEFEKTIENPDIGNEAQTDRIRLLDRIERNILEKKTGLEDERVNATWGMQNNDMDELWFGVQYGAMIAYKSNSDLFPEDEREQYGFNIDGAISEDEKNYEEEIRNDSIKNRCGNTLESYRRFGESIGRINVKQKVYSGKEYNTILNALKGEENRELKARYLFNNSGGGVMTGAVSDYASTYTENLRVAICNGGLLNGVVDLTDKNLTIKGLFNALPITEEEKQQYFSRQAEGAAEMKVFDTFSYGADAVDMEQFSDYMSRALSGIWIARGLKKEETLLSVRDKKYSEQFTNNLDGSDTNRDEVYAPIQGWVDNEGKTISDELFRARTVFNLQRSNAALDSKKKMGVDPSTEVGRFYQNSLRMKDTYVSEIVKDRKPSREVMDKIVADNKNLKLARTNIKNLPVNYDIYIEKHTGGRGGETPEKMVENLSKTLAAYSLKKLGRKFDVKTIRKMAEHIKETHNLGSLVERPAELREALRDENSALKLGDKIRNEIYSVSPERQNDYCTQLGELLNNMMNTKGRSAKYTKLYNSIRDAAALQIENMSPEDKASAICTANLKIIEAIKGYTKGKEKVRSTDDGKDSFDNALDALAIVSRFAPGTAGKKDKIIQDINNVRNHNNPDAANYIDAGTLEENYGVAHSKALLDARIIRKHGAVDHEGRISDKRRM